MVKTRVLVKNVPPIHKILMYSPQIWYMCGYKFPITWQNVAQKGLA